MKAILINEQPRYHKDIKDSETKELFGRHIDGFKYADDATLVELGFKEVVIQTILGTQYFGIWHETNTEILRYVIDKTETEIREDFNNNKAQLILKIDQDTDAFIKSVVGERSSEYEIAESEAISFKDAGYPELEVPVSVSSDAIANGYSNTIACDLILKMSTEWRSVQSALRSNRLMLKVQAKNAMTKDELDIAEQTWNEFINYIKQQIS